MRKFWDTIEDNVTGKPVANAEISVLTAALVEVSLFSDDGITATDNPVTTDSYGYFEFYVADGTYTLQISYDGEVKKTITDVEIAENVAADIGALGVRMDAAELVTQDATVAAFKGLTGATDKVPYFNGTDTMALADFTAAGRAIVDDASASAQLTTLGFSTFGKTVIDDADATAARVTLGAAASGAATASGLTVSTDKLLGRDTAGTGAIEEIAPGRGLQFDGGNLKVTLVTGSASGNDPNPVNIPAVSSFSWVNQGTATATDSAAGLGIFLTNDVDAEHHILEVNAPATPFDVYARFTPLMLEASSSGNMANQPGIVLRDSGSGKFIALLTDQIRATADLQYRLDIQRWTNATTIDTSPVAKYTHQYYNWVRANVTSTTITFYLCFAGQWVSIGTETIATFVGTIDKVGFTMRSDTGMDEAYCAIGNFGFTDPLV